MRRWVAAKKRLDLEKLEVVLFNGFRHRKKKKPTLLFKMRLCLNSKCKLHECFQEINFTWDVLSHCPEATEAYMLLFGPKLKNLTQYKAGCGETSLFFRPSLATRMRREFYVSDSHRPSRSHPVR